MADIEALFGRSATLRVRYTADEVTIEAERRVILRQG
jgi:plasmid stability protein